MVRMPPGKHLHSSVSLSPSEHTARQVRKEMRIGRFRAFGLRDPGFRVPAVRPGLGCVWQGDRRSANARTPRAESWRQICSPQVIDVGRDQRDRVIREGGEFHPRVVDDLLLAPGHSDEVADE